MKKKVKILGFALIVVVSFFNISVLTNINQDSRGIDLISLSQSLAQTNTENSGAKPGYYQTSYDETYDKGQLYDVVAEVEAGAFVKVKVGTKYKYKATKTVTVFDIRCCIGGDPIDRCGDYPPCPGVN